MNAPGQRPPMLTVREALDVLLAAARPVTAIETIPTLDANGRVLAEDQLATIDVPSADNTQMDGYAVRGADVAEAGAQLRQI
ncbi:MAG: molybdopterin molybdenumtransferase MoeA, partial [Massilia sp.]